MKKLIYISGIACLNLVVIGGLFKIMHWPYAGLMLTVGMLALAFLIFPAAFINSYKAERQSKTVYIVGFICAFGYIMGALFKIMHWPAAGPIMVLTLPLPVVLFLPVYIYHQKKSKTESQTNLIGVMFLMAYYSLFSVIMSMNVSKNILNNYIVNDVLVNDRKEAFEMKTQMDFQSIDTLNDQTKFKQIREQSNELTAYIHNLKTELIVAADKMDPKVADTISYSNIIFKDNTDVPNNILLGGNNDDGRGAKASELKRKIETYRNQITQIISHDKNAIGLINNMFTLKGKYSLGAGREFTWEMNQFMYSTLISTLFKLTNIEMQVRLAESEAIQALKRS